MTRISIPLSLKAIKDNAFCGCKSLKEIEIPSSVTSIAENAFIGCISLAGKLKGFDTSEKPKNQGTALQWSTLDSISTGNSWNTERNERSSSLKKDNGQYVSRQSWINSNNNSSWNSNDNSNSSSLIVSLITDSIKTANDTSSMQVMHKSFNSNKSNGFYRLYSQNKIEFNSANSIKFWNDLSSQPNKMAIQENSQPLPIENPISNETDHTMTQINEQLKPNIEEEEETNAKQRRSHSVSSKRKKKLKKRIPKFTDNYEEEEDFMNLYQQQQFLPNQYYYQPQQFVPNQYYYQPQMFAVNQMNYQQQALYEAQMMQMPMLQAMQMNGANQVQLNQESQTEPMQRRAKKKKSHK